MNIHNKVLLHMHIAALLLGGTALFSKLIPYAAWDIIAYRTLICGLTVFIVALLFKQKLRISTLPVFLLLVFCSMLFTVHWTAYFQAMQLSTVAIGMISMFTFPVMTVFLEPLINKTRLHKADILMGLLVMLGVFMIVPDFTLENNVTAGVLFGLLSALAVALRNILVSKHLSDISPFTIMFYHAMVSAAILLPFASVSPVEIKTPDLLALILLGTVFTAIPHTQKTYALRYRSAKSVSMVISLQVVYGSLFAYLLLREGIGFNTLLGGGIILFAALYESVFAKH
ncbi:MULTISPECIES: DMT family transporter [unclassified Oleiphilus]|jgi:drug/metabolite transporter (DMT)-like permease|uniref:DMT family transporter n=2 Tax=Oleiphilus TaxID=141450 RepID=UPI0007C39F77|nr:MULTISPECIES: DMT family transporter [unclassified Oleiphilus]KZZ31610.1 hypothetical protein A3756_06800 [Oleiphilus sp. HI0086]